jgi:hypothetical protein
MNDKRAELAALLTRASAVEAQRQAAAHRGDQTAARELARELERLRNRHDTLEQSARGAA